MPKNTLHTINFSYNSTDSAGASIYLCTMCWSLIQKNATYGACVQSPSGPQLEARTNSPPPRHTTEIWMERPPGRSVDISHSFPVDLQLVICPTGWTGIFNGRYLCRWTLEHRL